MSKHLRRREVLVRDETSHQEVAFHDMTRRNQIMDASIYCYRAAW
jgi:hypothetical protein